MFCPTCGKDNSSGVKFCASCGTNLEAVALTLTGREEDFFTKFDAGFDQFIARYSEHVFKNAASGSTDHTVARSWRLLGQAVLTTLLDIFLFTLMWNVLPLRFLILLISTPFRLLSERGKDRRAEGPFVEDYRPPEVSEQMSRLCLVDSVPSVTENTTVNLGSTAGTKEKAAPVTDRLE